MSLMDAIAATKPAWVTWWLNWLLVGAFILPLVLLIWKRSRKVGAITFVVSVVAGLLVNWMYQQMGYVRLLGLPHIVLWTPLALYLYYSARQPDMPKSARYILWVVLLTILVSLAFDYTDAIRWLLGDRTPLATAG